MKYYDIDLSSIDYAMLVYTWQHFLDWKNPEFKVSFTYKGVRFKNAEEESGNRRKKNALLGR